MKTCRKECECSGACDGRHYPGWEPHMKIRGRRDLQEAIRLILGDGRPRTSREILQELITRFEFAQGFNPSVVMVSRQAPVVANHKRKAPGDRPDRKVYYWAII